MQEQGSLQQVRGAKVSLCEPNAYVGSQRAPIGALVHCIMELFLNLPFPICTTWIRDQRIDPPHGNQSDIKLLMSLCCFKSFTSSHHPQEKSKFFSMTPGFIIWSSSAYPNSFHTSFPLYFSSISLKPC